MRVAIFIDGANLFFTQRNQLGWTIDLRRFWMFFDQHYGEVVDSYYYTSFNPNDEIQMRFVQSLPSLGYTVVSKPLKEIDTGYGIKRKANLDIEIVLDLFNTIENYDMAVLFSGDGDFQRPLEQLRTRGKKFVVVSSVGSVAKELLAVAGRNFIDIASIEQYVRLPGSSYPLNSSNQNRFVQSQPLERNI